MRIDNKVYSTGRYKFPGRVLGSYGLTGPNVLVVDNASSYYEISNLCKTCNTVGFVLNLTPKEEADLKQYYRAMIANSKRDPARSNWHLLPDEYKFVGNNCSSTVVNALKSVLPWYQSMFFPGAPTPQGLDLNLRMSPFLVKKIVHYQGEK